MTLEATAKHLFESGHTELDIEAMGLVGLTDKCRTLRLTAPTRPTEFNFIVWQVGVYERARAAADVSRSWPVHIVRNDDAGGGRVVVICDTCGGPVPEMGGAESILALHSYRVIALHQGWHAEQDAAARQEAKA